MENSIFRGVIFVKVAMVSEGEGYVGFYDVYFGLQGSQVGLYLFVGLFTHGLFLEQGVLPVHAVLGQLQLHFELSQLGL